MIIINILGFILLAFIVYRVAVALLVLRHIPTAYYGLIEKSERKHGLFTAMAVTFIVALVNAHDHVKIGHGSVWWNHLKSGINPVINVRYTNNVPVLINMKRAHSVGQRVFEFEILSTKVYVEFIEVWKKETWKSGYPVIWLDVRGDVTSEIRDVMAHLLSMYRVDLLVSASGYKPEFSFAELLEYRGIDMLYFSAYD